MADRTVVLDRLLALTVLFDRDMRRAFEGTGLTMARVRLLWELQRLGPSTQSALATALEVSPRNVTLLVDTLEGLGYVTRNPHPTDRRATVVMLTETAAEAMVRMAEEHQELAAELTASLDDTEIERLGRTLAGLETRLRELMDADERRRAEEGA